MKVYKLFLRMLKANTVMLMFSLGIFVIFIALMMRSAPTRLVNDGPRKVSVLVVNHDSGEYGELLVNFLGETTNIKSESEYGDDLKDAIFFKEVEYVLDIPQDFSESFMNGNPHLEANDVVSGMSTVAINQNIGNYLKILNTQVKLNGDLSMSELQKETMDIYSKQVKASVLNDVESTKLLDKTFLSLMIYPILLTALSTIVAIVRSVFSEVTKARLLCAPIKTTELLSGILIGSFLLMSGFFLLQILILSAFGIPILASENILFVANLYLFTLTTAMMSVCVGLMVTGKSVNSGTIIGNLLSLGSSFLTGVFIPQEILPSYVLAVSRLFPSFWTVHANEVIQASGGVFTSEIGILFVVQVLYIIMFAIISAVQFRGHRQIEE